MGDLITAGMGKKPWPFIMDRFTKLQSGAIAWDSIQEYVKEREDPEHCAYCGRAAELTLDCVPPPPSLHLHQSG